MAITNTTRRLDRRIVARDTNSYNGLHWVGEYYSSRPETSRDGLLQLFNKMLTHQQREAEAKAEYTAMVDAARLAEWEFHNAVLAMRALIWGQFGVDSDEAQAVGLKKKSKRKKPSKPTKENV